MSVEEANQKAMDLAKADRLFVQRSLREWAHAIGCSDGLVAKLPLWRATIMSIPLSESGGKRGPAPDAFPKWERNVAAHRAAIDRWLAAPYRVYSPAATASPPVRPVPHPFPARDDSAGWLCWWDAWREAGRRPTDEQLLAGLQTELEAVHKKILGDGNTEAPPARVAACAPADPNDAEVIRRASEAKNGDKFRRLWEGDYGSYGSQSEAGRGRAVLGLTYCASRLRDEGGRVLRLLSQAGAPESSQTDSPPETNSPLGVQRRGFA